jgi:cytochrome c1
MNTFRVLGAVAACTLLAACSDGRWPAYANGVGTTMAARRGVAVIDRYHCGACHRIPGVAGAQGTLAPPLDAFARRGFVAGVLPNTPENLQRWLRDPPAVDPLTAMPRLGLSDADARDAAAYLQTLR